MLMACNIKAVDRGDVEHRLLHSQIFTNLAVKADRFLSQMETETTSIPNTDASWRRSRFHVITSDRKLSSEEP